MHLDEILRIANPKQLAAIKHPLAPLMIIAGAGTGKTFTLENRIIYMIQQYGVKPDSILTITYTEKAAKELKSRLHEKIGQKVHPMFVGTFHSFCYKLMKDYQINNADSSSLIDQSEAVHMILENYDDFMPFMSEEFSINPKISVVESFIPFFNRLRDELVDIDKIDQSILKDFYEDDVESLDQLNDLLRIFPIYQNLKKENNLIDYNDMIDDKELIRKFTSGDEKAFDQIVQNNLNNVFGFFMKITRDEMAAEDLTQDVFLKLYKNLKNFRYESNFSTYLYRINSNTANSWITRNKWKGMLHLEQIAEEGKYDQKNDFEWTRQELWEEIAKLPKKQRKVVILRVTDGLSYRDISEITGMSEGTAKVNFHHGLKRLKEKLNND